MSTALQSNGKTGSTIRSPEATLASISDAAPPLVDVELIQHDQSAALRFLLFSGRRCHFDVLSQLSAKRRRAFLVGRLASPRYYAGERATGPGHARQQVQQHVDAMTELRTRVAAQ